MQCLFLFKTGNIHVDGVEYKLEPAKAHMRSSQGHLGVAHTLEPLQKKYLQVNKDGEKIYNVSVIDVVRKYF